MKPNSWTEREPTQNYLFWILFILNFPRIFKWTFYKRVQTTKSNFVRGKFLKIRISINLLLDHVRSHKKIWARSVQPFWRLLDTNKQTDIQAKYLQGVPKKQGNSVTNWISSLLWISTVIPNFKSHNIIMSLFYEKGKIL